MENIALKPEDFIVTKLGKPEFDSPVRVNLFIPENDRFLFDIKESTIKKHIETGEPLITIERCGPREKIFFNPDKTNAAIVTCGGLCPGINNVINAITMELLHQYNIPSVIGYRYGFKGLADRSLEVKELTYQTVAGISELGGSILGSSRGPQNIGVIVDRLIDDDIQILFVIGGDGSLKGGEAIFEEIQKRQLPISVIAIPKTIDNDLNFISKSFGFQTAYSKAVESIKCVHTESLGFENGIGIVKLMGRHSGAIAANATIASGDVNFCLIPEIAFKMDGPDGLLEALHKRLLYRDHAVIVIAEGAGQDIVPPTNEKDASGNVKLPDVGIWLRDQIKNYFDKKNINCTIKYIDPSYIIRSVPAIADDALFCAILGQYAAHAAMSGRTGVVIGQWNHFFANFPIRTVIRDRKVVNVRGSIWSSVLESTGQKLPG